MPLLPELEENGVECIVRLNWVIPSQVLVHLQNKERESHMILCKICDIHVYIMYIYVQ